MSGLRVALEILKRFWRAIVEPDADVSTGRILTGAALSRVPSGSVVAVLGKPRLAMRTPSGGVVAFEADWSIADLGVVLEELLSGDQTRLLAGDADEAIELLASILGLSAHEMADLARRRA